MLLNWLKDQPFYPKLYWATKRGAIAAAGTSLEQGLHQFGWQLFSQKSPRFFNPLVIKRGQHQPVSISPYLIKQSSSIPNREEWSEIVTQALSKISLNCFEKVVLARKKLIDCLTPIDPYLLCSALEGQTVFLLQQDASSTFLGATPETLYQRVGRMIECEALAGTRLLQFQAELMHSEKEQREFLFVQNFLLDALAPLCSSPPSARAIEIKKSTTTCHLHSKIRGVLKEEVTDEDILTALHPTPAVGGFPRQEALSFLANREPFERSLYAGTIGWKDSNEAEFAVAIRSALIQNHSAHFYAGAGIVEKSIPLLEWEETEWKFSLWNQFFATS